MLEGVRNFIDKVLADSLDARVRKSLAFTVAGMIESRSAVCAEAAREAPGDVADKHKIKRVDRLIGNPRLEVLKVCRGLLKAYAFTPGQQVALSLDWTTVGKHEVMTTSVIIGSRAMPFHWTVIDTKKTRKILAQQQHVEDLADLLPAGINFTLLFDAGYDDGDFVRKVLQLGLVAVIRSSKTVCIKPIADEWINLSTFEFERGRLYDWGEVLYTRAHELRVRCVALFDHGHQDPWILVTNSTVDARTVVNLYSYRFQTEETYKDLKDVRGGMQLKGCRVKSVDRLARLLAVQIVAYWHMTLAGLHAESENLHRKMQANTLKRRVLAVWRVGRALIIRGASLCLTNLFSLLWRRIEDLSNSIGGGHACPQ